NLAAEFRKRRGCALEPLLPALVADAGSGGSRARYDFWQTVGELVSENYFGQIQQWCQRHHVASGGHLLMEESPAAHVPLYGDFFQCVRRVDAPSIDCLTSDPPHVPWFIARLHSSVAELEGRTVTMCETSDFQQRYRPAGDTRPVQQVTEEQIRGTCNRLLLNGITTITSYYSFAGLADEQLRRLNEWIGRCSTMLAGGHQVADIAVLYPIQSLWAHFTPARHGATDDTTAKQIAHIFHEAERQLYGACRDFIHVDAQALTEARVEESALVHGKLRWRAVILPCTDTLPLAAWEKLRDFWRAGGVVIALGTLPANTEREFPSAAVQAMSREMFGSADGPRIETNTRGGAGIFLPVGSEKMLPLTLDRVLESDVKLAGGPTPVHATHRRIAGREVYFIINDSDKPWSGDIVLAANGEARQWNPATGAVTPLPAASLIKLNLEPYGGTILTFTAAATPRRPQLERGALKQR
ncbi:MAG: hypothetical protein FJ388_19960, partial [Verrucomicrobia bacterium]|nr:hypothetical protein [Verrucomicrobiota bacterium]